MYSPHFQTLMYFATPKKANALTVEVVMVQVRYNRDQLELNNLTNFFTGEC